MQLNAVDDPRSNLQKARRKELENYAIKHGIKEIKEEMPAIVMRSILASLGVKEIPLPNRTLGVPERPIGKETAPDQPIVTESTNVVDAEARLIMQWAEKKQPDAMSMAELRAECKKRGIKMARTDNMAALKGKLNGEIAT